MQICQNDMVENTFEFFLKMAKKCSNEKNYHK
jgi:hypothetical protein